MIQRNELRVGNKVLFDSEIDTITSIGEKCCNAEFKSMWNYDRVHPIPLTPEILEKCGWYKSTMDAHFEAFRRMTAFISEGKVINPLGLEVKYLHSLQNLYYALTGTELTIIL